MLEQRFLAAAQHSLAGGFGRLSPSVDAAARTLGVRPWGVIRRIHLPLLRPALLAGLLIVFVDVIKELPATLILRPFNFDTLAIQAYNLASGKEHTIRQLAEHIVELTGSEAGFELLPRRTWDTSGRRYGCPEKSKQELGFTAEVSLREGLEQTVAWTRANLDRIEACVAKHAEQLRASQVVG